MKIFISKIFLPATRLVVVNMCGAGRLIMLMEVLKTRGSIGKH